MRVLFFLVTFVSLSIQFEDHCASCNLPTVLPSGASSLCGDFPAPSHHSSMLRSSDATACYLSITGCDLYNVIAGGVCYVDNFNLKALLCINGTFSLPIPSSASYMPVHSIRCI